MDIGYAANEHIKINHIVNDFEFGIDEEIQYVITLSSPGAGRFRIKPLAEWINNLEEFPVYYCLISDKGFHHMFLEMCTLPYEVTEIENSRRKQLYYVVKANNKEELCSIAELIELFSMSVDDLSILSTKINPCRVGQVGDKGEFDIIILGDIQDASVFHIGHDGDSIYLLSNDKKFSTLEEAISKMPEAMLNKIEVIEYGGD
ncbi:hypothetical protein J45TS6_29660 [Paenibacillus sp. J45TS6]|uniref:hypothetical protein n=1 Tax=unclassified Paenibacillus TaxID=185978 RepID=UPI001B00DD81|nr:hypothetical protein [Paenibacillus sp. J45TS6]GIP44507.1 hypothetical protein J45TS6_29660 [Paenibacillus sp. J45TS6]